MGEGGTRGARRAERAYRLLLRWYPAGFRERHGDEMLRLFLERRRDAHRRGGVWSRTRFLAGAAWDVARNGLAERREKRAEADRGGGVPIAGARAAYNRRGGGGMEGFINDTRYALRTLLKAPGFALVAVLTIALGIGANTAIFSVVRAVLLQPLPYEDPGELVILWGEMRTRGVTHFPSSPPDFRDYAEQADLLEGLAAVFTFQASLTGDGDPEQVDVGGVTQNFFRVLGVEPMLGRNFSEEDGAPNPPGVNPGTAGALPGSALLSHALWQQRYGGDPGVIGTTLLVGGAPSEIVGVMPAGFELLMPPTAALADDVDIWLAARIDYANAPRNNVFLRPVGRLRDGATAVQLQSQVERISAELTADDQVKSGAGYYMRVEEMQGEVTAHVRPVLLSLFGAVVFVLLIACANVSNLLLVRATRRERELAVRSAMGGSRRRLVRQLLIESGLLAVAGAALGLLLASGGIRLLMVLQPDDLPRIDTVRIDGLVLGFTCAAAAAAAIVFGLMPALQASRMELAEALKDRGQAASRRGRRLLRDGVVVAEVALSLVLLIGAGLMVRSFVALTNVSPGFEAEGVLTLGVSVPFAGYPQAIDRSNLQLEIQRAFEAVPGVEIASSVGPLPLGGGLFNGRYGGEEALDDPEAFGQAAYVSVLPGYFEAMGTRLLSGRLFDQADLADSAAVVVVDEKLAASLWPDRSPIGERFLIRAVSPEPQFVEVIGVVEHQRAQSLAAEGMETVYYTDRYLGSFGGTWVVRAGVDPLSLVGALRDAVASVDPSLPVADVRLMSGYVDEAMGPTRFALTLIGVFGVIALLLATVGLYGVLSYLVGQRTAEIGVRMAFGAERSGILALVVRQGLALAGVGVLVGVVAALGLTGAMESLLVGVTPTDPLTFVGISATFVTVAALACYVPARRATRVDPVTALRED